MNIKSKLATSLSIVAFFIFLGLAPANASVEPGWPAGTPNQCKNPTDGFINFELGAEKSQIQSTIPGLEFTTTSGINWRYADTRTGNYNVPTYSVNGNFFAWLGVTGDRGKITFSGGTASYVSVLVSTYSGVVLDAYDVDGNFLATSGWATNNLNTGTLTRLTVESPGIAYVEIHDTGNYWLMDDLCTDAPSPCQPLPGRANGNTNERIDLVFVPNEDYNGDMDTFLNDVNNNINNRLGAVVPIDTNLDRFNFYYTRLEGKVSSSSNNCGRENSLPDDLLKKCPYADAVVVLHTATFGDCAANSGAVGIFSAEGEIGRSFIHEGGHGIFGLRDEYDSSRESGSCDYTAYNTSRPLPSNIWATEASCRTDALDEGWDQNQCYMFTSCQDDWWKLGNPSLADNDAKYNDSNFRYIMFDGNYFSNGFGTASERRINWVFDHRPTTPEPPLPSPSKEKSIILELNISDNGLTLLDSNFITAPPPDYLPGEYSLVAKISTIDGNLLGEYGFPDPRLIYAELGYAGSSILESAKFTLLLPYFNNVGKADIVDGKTGTLLLSVDLSSFATQPGGGNNPPVALCKNISVSANDSCQANASVDNGSYDPDGDPITLTQSPLSPYSLGGTGVTLTATDSNGASASCTATVTVVDTTPPAITSVTANPNILWPPNHKMFLVQVNAATSDNCTAAPVCKITSVASNEPDNGLGDGDTAPDWQITGDLTVNLRAERSGNGTGRMYTVNGVCNDAAGNVASWSTTVTVPHDQGN